MQSLPSQLLLHKVNERFCTVSAHIRRLEFISLLFMFISFLPETFFWFLHKHQFSAAPLVCSEHIHLQSLLKVWKHLNADDTVSYFPRKCKAYVELKNDIQEYLMNLINSLEQQWNNCTHHLFWRWTSNLFFILLMLFSAISWSHVQHSCYYPNQFLWSFQDNYCQTRIIRMFFRIPASLHPL